MCVVPKLRDVCNESTILETYLDIKRVPRQNNIETTHCDHVECSPHLMHPMSTVFVLVCVCVLVLFCFVVFCFILSCVVLFFRVMFCINLYCFVLFCIVVFRVVLS